MIRRKFLSGLIALIPTSLCSKLAASSKETFSSYYDLGKYKSHTLNFSCAQWPELTIIFEKGYEKYLLFSLQRDITRELIKHLVDKIDKNIAEYYVKAKCIDNAYGYKRIIIDDQYYFAPTEIKYTANDNGSLVMKINHINL